MKWTEAQQSAIDAPRPSDLPSQTILVAAAAGSGKTAVLVERIIGRLKRKEISIQELLVVTFTKAAAAEMSARIGAKLSEEYNATGDEYLEEQLQLLSSAHISTLHSFCQWVIRNYFYCLDIDPTFRIANEGELGLLRDEVLTQVLLKAYENNEHAIYDLADMVSNKKSDDSLKSVVLKLADFAMAQSQPRRWLHAIRGMYGSEEAVPILDTLWGKFFWDEQQQLIQKVQDLYNQAHELGKVDYDKAFASWLEGADQVKPLMEALRSAQTWDAMNLAVQSLEGFVFKRLVPTKKIKEADPHMSSQFKYILTTAKEILQGMKEGPFIMSDTDWKSQWHTMRIMAQGMVGLTIEYLDAFEAAKGQEGIVDFNDLEHMCLALLIKPGTEEHPKPSEVALELQGQFKEIMVDEYQDTNAVQEAIVDLVSKRDNRFYVGDIKQSIYGFRMADPSLFLEKYEKFSSSEKGDPLHDVERRIDLSQNFRSHENILEVTNFIFRQIMTKEGAELDYGDAEALYAGRKIEDAPPNWVGGDVEVHLIDISKKNDPADDSGEFKADDFGGAGANSFEDGQSFIDSESDDEKTLANEEQEMLFIARKIKEMHEQGLQVQESNGTFRPMEWRDIVILYRAVSKTATQMVEILRTMGIPAYAEEKTGYFSAMEVRILLALLQIIDNPEQDLPMAVVLQSPIVGLDANDLGKLRLSGNGTLWQLLPVFGAKEQHERCIHFVEQLNRWRTLSRRYEVSHLIWQILEETRYVDYVSAMPNGILRRANVLALYDRAKQFENGSFRGLFRFLRFLESLQEAGEDLGIAKTVSEADNVVRIMSIHKSKGLEFPIVFIGKIHKHFNVRDMGQPFLLHKEEGIAVKGYYPDLRVMYQSIPWLYVKQRLEQAVKAEEERLLYVALTRAKDKLFLIGTIKKDKENKLPKDMSSLIDKALSCPTVALPKEAILGSNSYLGWIILALSRHLDGGNLLRQYSTLEDIELPPIPHKQCRISFTIEDGEEYRVLTEEQDEINYELITMVKENLPIQGEPLDVEIENRFAFTYSFGEAVETPAKISVTEIKRRFAEIEELAETDKALSASCEGSGLCGIPLAPVEGLDSSDDAAADLPQVDLGPFGTVIASMTEQEELRSGTRWGTLMHEAMQWLPPMKEYTKESLRIELDRLCDKGYFTDEERKVISVNSLLAFFESSLGVRLLQSPQVERELPFSRLIDADRVYTTVEKGEELFLQGIIDTVFLEGDEWVLIDYKTDRVQDPEELVQRYRIQLALYKEALEQLTNKRVKEVYIYSFRHNAAIAVDVDV